MKDYIKKMFDDKTANHLCHFLDNKSSIEDFMILLSKIDIVPLKEYLIKIEALIGDDIRDALKGINQYYYDKIKESMSEIEEYPEVWYEGAKKDKLYLRLVERGEHVYLELVNKDGNRDQYFMQFSKDKNIFFQLNIGRFKEIQKKSGLYLDENTKQLKDVYTR